jgi:hypothetical protein
MVVLTPVALCVPSTPAEIGDLTDPSLGVKPFMICLFFSSGGAVEAIPTFL